ncbi:hypothetical protein WMF27_01330 [Sorangium sp. So ce281]|uniref:hypothetical protein n=1 Tax=unclassified Sorangium TaxID=2621164 RepID=UPI003F614EFA
MLSLVEGYARLEREFPQIVCVGAARPPGCLAAFAPGAFCSLGVHALHFVIDNALADATI